MWDAVETPTASSGIREAPSGPGSRWEGRAGWLWGELQRGKWPRACPRGRAEQGPRAPAVGGLGAQQPPLRPRAPRMPAEGPH